MAAGLNRVTILGRLVKDPEVKRTSNNKLVANFRVATEEKWKDRDGQWQKKTEYVPVVVWGDGLVETIETYVRKGSEIYVEGKFQTREWEKNGEKRYTTEVVVQGTGGRINFFSPPKGRDERNDRSAGSDRQGDGWGSSTGEQSSFGSGFGGGGRRPAGDDLDDEIPF